MQRKNNSTRDEVTSTTGPKTREVRSRQLPGGQGLGFELKHGFVMTFLE